MSSIAVQSVILCGGSGTRLWPLSRAGFPKQFLCLSGAESLFQQAAKRLEGAPFVICNEEHRFLAQEQLREAGIADAQFILEPAGRNTAPALTLAALAKGEDPVLVVTPADQIISDDRAFQLARLQAVELAAAGDIVIFGIAPSKPETGYGYIKVDRAAVQNGSVHSVERFVEKPDAITAQHYLDDGAYFWNAGMFVLKASVWLEALQHFRPDILSATQMAWEGRGRDGYFLRPDREYFQLVPSESIDYAVMEKCTGTNFAIKMVSLNAGWSDLGAWEAVWDALPKDSQGNAKAGDVIVVDSHDTLVQANSRLVTLVGVKDLVVIETPDAVLVADKSYSQNVKRVVEQLALQQRDEQTLHRKVHRPWGWYDSIDAGDRFKVKRIQVKPKASLSLQKHYHRAEHWIVVKGTAEITNGDKVLTLAENQSTYIPLGEVHRLANPGTIPLEIIEVQSGSYLGEDDIVRLEDTYGRG